MHTICDDRLAASITKAASRQTYHTIRWLVDRPRVPDAFRAYAYFRWVDDQLDGSMTSAAERQEFLARQQTLMEACLSGDRPRPAGAEEHMLADLIRGDTDPDSGLRIYIRDMMAVMAFDAGRRGGLVSAAQLSRYTRLLGSAVTEALHHFIGHGCAAPRDDSRYLAVEAAHITHMLRDTLDDVRAGYYNIPSEYISAHRIEPGDIDHPAFRAWVAGRVQLARTRFEAGRKYLARVRNPRCRLAGFAYTARFEAVLEAIENDEFRLRADYHELNVPGTLLAAAASLFMPASRAARQARTPAGAGRVGLESPAVRKP